MSTPDTGIAPSDESSSVKREYLEAIKLIERLHRQFLEVVKTELDRISVEDINNIKALILFNIGEAELTVGELTNRGYYIGYNVSYHVRKMVENGSLVLDLSTQDRRQKSEERSGGQEGVRTCRSR